LAAADDRGIDAQRRLEMYAAACSAASRMLDPDSQASRWLSEAAQSATEAAEATEEIEPTIRATLEQLADQLAFRPLIEAELPRDFPPPTPVGEIEIKGYPAYRKAEASGSGGSPFWTLFKHIKAEGIAMTAPVQMDYAADLESDVEQRSLAFLYGRPDQGEPTSDGPVTVADVPPMRVASTGVRGDRTPKRIAAARQRLLDWLHEDCDEYEPDGEIRVFGYNSPFIPSDRRYIEVQIPVRPRAETHARHADRDIDLSEFRWNHRVLLLFDRSPDDPVHADLLADWRQRTFEVSDRNLLLIRIHEEGGSLAGGSRLSASAASKLRAQFDVRPGQPTAILIGKDGGEKLRLPTVELSELFERIDVMPMRRAEMLRANRP
jgi:hypothetical protein